MVAHSDYAGNGGNTIPNVFAGANGDGPPDLATGDSTNAAPVSPPVPGFTGLFYMRSQTRVADIVDGTSQTFLFGEKYLDPDYYYTGTDGGDNQSMYQGYDADSIRFTSLSHSASEHVASARPTGGLQLLSIWQSASQRGELRLLRWVGVSIQFTVDPNVFGYLGDRRDGKIPTY